MKITQKIGLFVLMFSSLFVFESVASNNTENPVDYSHLELAKQPNILWLVTEDIGHYLPSFGDSTIETPNLSKLAEEGICYPNLFSVAGVCAPSRSAIITGMYPSGMGSSNMRTTSNTKETGLPKYGGIPPEDVRMVSELLRMQGYYCSNNFKEDYQFKAPMTGWDESSAYAHWRDKAKDQPFFAVFNFTDTHESGLFDPYGFKNIETRYYHLGDRNYKWAHGRMTESETTVYLPKDTKFKIPPYLPNTPVVRRDMWKLYNNIAEMDKQMGVVLQQLKDDGLYDNTIIVFYSDHGGPLPRQKRLIYDSGLKTPMIIRFPKKQQAKKYDDQLISFVDFAPTLLSLVGVKPPKYMQGQAFLGPYRAKEKREYIYAAADRFDEVTDAIRAVRDKQYKYVRNYRPEQPYYLALAYREKIPSMQELLSLHAAGKLKAIQEQWFREKKDPEELFDCIADPNELYNLAALPEYKKDLDRLRKKMDKWLKAIGDQPNIPEAELIKQLWKGSDTQPVTVDPIVKQDGEKITIVSATKGASIGYKVVLDNNKLPMSWTVYQGPFDLPIGAEIEVKAHRIGFVASHVIKYKSVN